MLGTVTPHQGAREWLRSWGGEEKDEGVQAEHNTEVTVQTADVGPLDTGDPLFVRVSSFDLIMSYWVFFVPLHLS